MDITQVVTLINALSAPQQNVDIVQAQQALQQVQRSPQGYEVANQLLLMDPAQVPNAGYFGALTLTVQLNTNVATREQLWALFKSNLAHLARLSNIFLSNPNNSGTVWTTIKKLMSNCSLIFTNLNSDVSQITDDNGNIPSFWNNPIDTLITILQNYNQLQEQQWMNVDDPKTNSFLLGTVNNSLAYDQLMAFIAQNPANNKLLLNFTQIIVEDLIKLQSHKTTMSHVYEIVHHHLYISTMSIINYDLTNYNNYDDQLFQCISAWINYISMVRNVSPHGKLDLSEMVSNLINLMCNVNDNYNTAEKILSIFASIFANDPLIIDYNQRTQLEILLLGTSREGSSSQNQFIMQYMNHLVTNELYDQLKELAACIVDFIQLNNMDICNKLFTSVGIQNTNNNMDEYVKVLLQLTNFPLIPILQEHFSVKMVEFWLDLAESYTNLPQETLHVNATNMAINIFEQVLNIYLPKISLGNKQKILEEYAEDENEVRAFDDFRTNVSEMIESFWVILGNDKLTNVLIQGISQISDSLDVFQIETMSLLLNVLLVDMDLRESVWISDIIGSNGASFFKNLYFLFQTGYSNIVASNVISRSLQTNFVRTFTVLVGTLAGYFETDIPQLSTVIDNLFKGLEVCAVQTNDSITREINDKLETFIINAISKLCDDCRKQLKSFLGQFMNVLNSILSPNSNMSNFTRTQLVKSIGFILQGVIESGPKEQGGYINNLVDTLIQLIHETSENTNSQQIQFQIAYIHCLCTCISELGISLNQPKQMEDSEILPRLQEFQSYWNEDPLNIRNKLLNTLDKLLSNPLYGKRVEFVEISCLILGNALTLPPEEPHFLKFQMPQIMDFLLKHLTTCELNTSLPYFVFLLEKVITQFKMSLSPQDFDFMLDKFFLPFYQEIIIRDPDLVQMTVNFINHTLDVKPGLAIHSSHWTTFILPEFMKLLASKEKFTLHSATKFFSKVINNKKYTQEDLAIVQQQVNTIGQQIIYQAMNGLFNTQRSDLNAFTELLRAMVAKYPAQTKNWFIIVLPQICNNDKAHKSFIHKMEVTRGNRASGNAILEWWLACNALPSLQ